MRKPKTGPAAYLLLGGEGNRRTQASPARSASFLRVSVLRLGTERMCARTGSSTRSASTSTSCAANPHEFASSAFAGGIYTRLECPDRSSR
jgi:hypothetical protein